jgi:hypothetical protein
MVLAAGCHGSGCYTTCFWLFQYVFLVVKVLVVTVIVSGYYSNCFYFLKYSFLVVIQYSSLVITALVSAYFWLLHYSVLVVTVRVSACYGTCF